MTTKEYLKEWDLNEERTPIEGFKIGDFVKVVGFNKNARVDVGKGLLGRFGVIESMKEDGKPDGIVFVTSRGKDTDEADLANKFIFKLAKKCPECGVLKAVDEPCKKCAKKQLKEESLDEGFLDKSKALAQSFKKNFKNTILALSLAINLLAGVNVIANNASEVNKEKQQLYNKIEQLKDLNLQSFAGQYSTLADGLFYMQKTPEQKEKILRQIEAQKHILGEVADVYNGISILKPAKSQEKKIEDAIKKAEMCIKFSEDTLKEIDEEKHNNADVRAYHNYNSKFNDKKMLKKHLASNWS